MTIGRAPPGGGPDPATGDGEAAPAQGDETGGEVQGGGHAPLGKEQLIKGLYRTVEREYCKN